MIDYTIEEFIGDIYIISNIDEKRMKKLNRDDDKLSACTVVLAEENVNILKINDKYIEESILDNYNMEDVIDMLTNDYAIDLKNEVKNPYIGELIVFNIRKRKKLTYIQ